MPTRSIALCIAALATACSRDPRLADVKSPSVTIQTETGEKGHVPLYVRLYELAADDGAILCAQITRPLSVSVDGEPMDVEAHGEGGRMPWYDRVGKGGVCEPLFVAGHVKATERASSRVEITDGSKTISVEIANLAAPRTIAVEGTLEPGHRATVDWLPATDLFQAPDDPSRNPDGPNLCVDFVYDDAAPRAPGVPPRSFRVPLLDYEKTVHDGKITWVNRSDARLDGNRLSFTVPARAAPGPGRLFLLPCDVSHSEVFPAVLSCTGATKCWAGFSLAWKDPGPFDGTVQANVVAPEAAK